MSIRAGSGAGRDFSAFSPEVIAASIRLFACASALVLCSACAAQETHFLWSRDGAPTSQAAQLLDVLRNAQLYGLSPENYAVARLPRGNAGWTEFDRVLSAQATRLLADLHSGQVDPRAAGFDLPRPRAKLDAELLLGRLASAADVRAVVESVEPKFYQYQLLKKALGRYRALASNQGLARLPPLPGLLREGNRYGGAPALRQLLAALGDIDASAAAVADSDLMDAQLIDGLRRFQQRHGLEADGILGPSTFAALGTPLSVRVQQIELTMERLRWLPAVSVAPVVVNIPQFRLFALESASPPPAVALQMPVIVGQVYPGSQTPVFMGRMSSIVFRPYWDVPQSILMRELLPQILAAPDYLEQHGFEIVQGWGDESRPVAATRENIDRLATGELRLRQRPGPDNALGLIKFDFPNVHNVYLHDTPARELFRESRRAFSHGCIRVADPVALAVRVLRDTPGDWSADNVLAAMRGDETRRVSLSSPIPVLVLYGTAVAGPAGTMHFFEDIYGHDARLAELLASRAALLARERSAAQSAR